MKRRLKINGVIIFCALVFLAAMPAVFLRVPAENDWFDGLARIVGIVLILMGQIIRVSARGFKSEQSNNSNSLVQTGPYELVRNPMYLGILLIGIGVVTMLFNWWVICIFSAFFVIRYILLIFSEEKKLRQFFPGAYDDYCRKSPRLIPSYKKIFKKDIAEYLPLRLSWIYREIGSMLTLLAVVLVMGVWGRMKSNTLQVYFNDLAVIFGVVFMFALFILWLAKRTQKINTHEK